MNPDKIFPEDKIRYKKLHVMDHTPLIIMYLSIRLLVVGGRDGLKTLNSMECLDLETSAWSQLSPMNTHRHGLGVAILNGPLYAVGGHDGWSYLNTVER